MLKVVQKKKDICTSPRMDMFGFPSDDTEVDRVLENIRFSELLVDAPPTKRAANDLLLDKLDKLVEEPLKDSELSKSRTSPSTTRPLLFFGPPPKRPLLPSLPALLSSPQPLAPAVDDDDESLRDEFEGRSFRRFGWGRGGEGS